MIKHYKFTGIVIVLILYAILMPGDSVPDVSIPYIDKVVHFGMFFVLTAVVSWEYMRANNRLPKWVWVFVGVMTFALSTEIMQLFADSRSFDLQDLVADGIGSLVASGIVVTIWKSYLKR